MPWIYYGDDSYCSCPHCESEEEDDMKYLPNEPSATRYDWENQSETPDEPECHFQPLPGEPLFYRLSTGSIGTPFASLHVWLADTPKPFELQEADTLNQPKETRVVEYVYPINESQEHRLWSNTPPEEVFKQEIQESIKHWNQ